MKEEEDHFEIDPVTGDLTLINMLEEDSGRYVCYAYNKAFQSVHYVDILGMERTRQVCRNEMNGDLGHEMNDVALGWEQPRLMR